MARLFDDASSEYLAISSAPVSALPLTLACWFNTDTLSINEGLIWIGDNTLNPQQIGIYVRGSDATDSVAAVQWATDGRQAYASNTASINTWHHATGIFASNSSRIAYIDGGGKVENTDVDTTPTLVDSAIGGFNDLTPGAYFSGMIAEAAIWNVALTDDEVAILAVGYSPLFVRPQSLVAYWPLIRDEDQDRVGGYDMTAYNTPTIAAHPPIIYPAQVYQGFAAAAEPPADLSINVNDDVTVGESISVSLPDALSVDVSDAVSIGESVSLAMSDLVIDITEPATVGESNEQTLDDLTVDITEPTTVGETVSVSLPDALAVDITEAVDVGESNDQALDDLTVNITEPVTVGESVNLVLPVAGEMYVNVTDSVTLGEIVTVGLDDHAVNVSDDTTVSDTVSASLLAEVNVADSVTVGDTTSIDPLALLLSVTDSITLGETVDLTLPGISFLVNVTDSVSVTDLLLVGFATYVHADRTCVIAAEDRSCEIESEDRSWSVDSEDRVYSI